MNRDSSEDDVMVLRDAQEWRLLPLGDSAERAAFMAWLRESPANVGAFLSDTMLSVELSDLDCARAFDLETLIATAMQSASESTSTTENSDVQAGVSEGVCTLDPSRSGPR